MGTETETLNPSIKRLDVVAKAREYLHTPFVHQGRLKGIGVDCVGLLIGIAHELDVCEVEQVAYRRQEDGRVLLEMLEKHLTRLPEDAEPLPGRILAFRYRNAPQHAAVVTEADGEGRFSIIHALERGVVEHALDERWKRRLCGIFEIPGMVD